MVGGMMAWVWGDAGGCMWLLADMRGRRVEREARLHGQLETWLTENWRGCVCSHVVLGIFARAEYDEAREVASAYKSTQVKSTSQVHFSINR